MPERSCKESNNLRHTLAGVLTGGNDYMDFTGVAIQWLFQEQIEKLRKEAQKAHEDVINLSPLDQSAIYWHSRGKYEAFLTAIAIFQGKL